MSLFKKLKNQIQTKHYSKTRCTPFDPNFFEGKRVCVIGGADTILMKKNGKYIDEYDVIVRINKGIELIEKQKEYLGSKTDYLFHSFYDINNEDKGSPFTIDLWKNSNLKKIIYAYPSSEKKFQWQFIKFNKVKSNLPICETTKKQYLNILNILESHVPTTGFVALKTIFDSNPRELFITGFSFFKTPMNSEYRQFTKEEFNLLITDTHHNHDLEFKYIKRIYEQNPNIIKIDDGLKTLFEQN